MRRTQRLLAMLLALALLAPCFCAAVAENEGGEQTPKEAKDKYVINGITYFKVDSDNFKDHPKQFLADLVNGISNEWMETIVGCLFAGDSYLTQRNYEVKRDYMQALWGELDERAGWYKPNNVYGVRSNAVYATSINQAIGKLKTSLRNKKPNAMNMPNDAKFSYGNEQMRSKEQDVVAVACYLQDHTSDNSNYSPGFMAGVVLYFTDFQAVALLPDASDAGNYVYTKYTETPGSGLVYASNVKNLTLVPVTASQSVTSGWSTTATSTVSGSESYGFSESIAIGASFDFLGSKISAKANFSASQTFSEGWSNSESEANTGSVSDSVSVALPPYTNVVMEQGSSTTVAETAYNCPIGLKYTVRAVGFTTQTSNHNWTFGPDARADLYKRAIQDGSLDIEQTSENNEAVHWQYVDYAEIDIPVGWEEYYKISSKNAYTYCAKHVPMSPQGAVFNETLVTHSTKVRTIAPILPLRIVKLQPPNISFISGEELSYGQFNYMHADMKVGDSSYTSLLTLSGQNADGADYYGFNPRNGSWKVVDKDGVELTGDDAPVRLEKLNDVSKNTKYIAQKPGTCFLKYEISEKAYPEDGISYADGMAGYNGGYTRNEQLASTAALEITVTEDEVKPAYTITVTGGYTGEVGKAAGKLEEKGLAVSICGEDGKELDEQYTWEARELPAKGISLSPDGTVEFTKPGTFHVRAVCQSHGIASDWAEITAFERKPAKVTTAPQPIDLIYNGSRQQLVTPGEAEGGELVYWLDANNNDTLPNGVSFSSPVPAQLEAGDYTVWYMALGDETHSDSQPDKVYVTIRKAPVEPVQPARDALVYNGRAQALVVAGTVEGGTLQYRVDDESNWDTDIPSRTDAGTYTVWYMVKGDANHNDIPPASLRVRIEKKPLVVTPTDAAKRYGEADPALTWTAVGLADTDSLVGKLERAKGENVGTYAIRQGSLSASDNYALYFNEGLFTVEPKPVTVKAKDASAVYGEADPVLEYTVEGLVGSDRLTGRLSREPGEDVGTYPITLGSLAASGNYEMSFEDAVFTIGKRPVTVTAQAASKVYGNEDPELGYTADGLVGLDQLAGQLAREPGENVGAYAIGRGTLVAGSNYDMTFAGADFTIAPRPLTVRAEDRVKAFGKADPELTWTAEGLVDGDSLDGSLVRDPGEAPGKYAIRQGTLLASANYALEFVGGVLEIQGREPLPVKPDYTLLAAMTTLGSNALRLRWTKVDGAQGYDVYFKNCDGDQDFPLAKSVRGLSCTFRKLNKGDTYKAYVQAWKKEGGNKVYIGDGSPAVHCIAGGSMEGYTNAKSVGLDKTRLTLVKGKAAKLKATAKGEKAKLKLLKHERAMRYYSSNANVARVSRTGKVTAVGGGSCVIYAVANNGVRAGAKVTVIADPKKVSFAQKSYNLAAGKAVKLAKQVNVNPAGLTPILSWSSSDPSVATVSSGGVVKGLKAGTVTITAITENGLQATTKVTVE